MNLVGMMPVRNEDWVLGLSARVALQWCDRLVILNHASTDRTEEIIQELRAEYGHRVLYITHHRTHWNEMDDRDWMLTFARANGSETGATHLAIIDADEILTANLLGGIREQVANLRTNQMLMLPGYNLRGSLDLYHLNGLWGQRQFSTAFKDVNTAAWKGDTFHHREPHGVKWEHLCMVRQGQGGTMHLWGASLRRLRAKHALYKVRERLQFPDKAVSGIEYTYNQWRDGRPDRKDTPNTWTFAETPMEWMGPYRPTIAEHLHMFDIPWQEEEVHKLVREYGSERFKGLDLFGLQ
jgi:glycosyl transferase family 2